MTLADFLTEKTSELEAGSQQFVAAVFPYRNVPISAACCEMCGCVVIDDEGTHEHLKKR